MGAHGFTAGGHARRVFAAALVVLGALLLAACGGGGKASVTATPATPAAVTPTSTVVVHAQPTIDGSSFLFPDRGYAAVIPDGWHANPNSLLAGPQEVDTFFSAETISGVQANISVTCEANSANVDTNQFVQNRVTTLTKLGATDMTALGTASVAGVDAATVSYTLTREDTQIAKSDVMFATAKCAWTLALASAPSALDQNEAVFAEFLKSFKLLPDVTPQAGG
jgi:hypothetical protein